MPSGNESEVPVQASWYLNGVGLRAGFISPGLLCQHPQIVWRMEHPSWQGWQTVFEQERFYGPFTPLFNYANYSWSLNIDWFEPH